MKILTIHHPDDLEQPDDFCWADEGEIAVPTIVVCDSECGCERSHSGVDTRRASTTLIVANYTRGPDSLVDTYVKFLEVAGWAKLLIGPGEVRTYAEQLAGDIMGNAEQWTEGTVVRPLWDPDSERWTYTPNNRKEPQMTEYKAYKAELITVAAASDASAATYGGDMAALEEWVEATNPAATTGGIDAQHDNNRRAWRAARTLVAYAAGESEDIETAIGDMLADVRHLCDATNLDFDYTVQKSVRYYSAEILGEL